MLASNLASNVAILTANLNTEISSRTVIGTSVANLTTNVAILSANLNTEIAARTALSSSLINEISRATLQENNLGTSIATTIANLNNEITSRTSGDATLTINIATEVTNRGAANNILITNVATVTANLNTVISTLTALTTTVTGEITRAFTAENVLSTNVATLTANLNTTASSITAITLSIENLTTNAATSTANLINEIASRASLGVSLNNQVATLSTNLNNEVVARTNQSATGCSSPSSSGVGLSTGAGNAEYWIDSEVLFSEAIGTTFNVANLAGTVLKILGVGFGTYYNPNFQVTFICYFFNAVLGNLSSFGVVTYAQVTNVLFYHVECPIPVVSTALSLTVSLYKSTGQLYPFGGFIGGNLVTVQYSWDSITTLPTANISVTGLGFNILNNVGYWCIFTGKNSTNNSLVVSYFSPNAINLTNLNCGGTPSGFAVIQGFSTASLTILEAFSNKSLGYQVLPSASSAVILNACVDNFKDGDETDADCGGTICGAKCLFNKTCLVNNDCSSGYCANNLCSPPLYNTSLFTSNAQFGGLLSPTLTSTMQALKSYVTPNVVTSCSLTVTMGNIVRITSKFFYESLGNEEDVDMVIFTSGPNTTSGYYDLAMPNYVKNLNNGAPTTILGINSIRTGGGVGQAGVLIMFDGHGGYNWYIYVYIYIYTI